MTKVFLALAVLFSVVHFAALAAAAEIQPAITQAMVVTGATPQVGDASTMEVLVTAYTAHDPGEDGRGITATQTLARSGVAAVDPAIIPLGTKLYIPGYGDAVAEDTGGAIKGRRIDVFIPEHTAALRWGIKVKTVVVIPQAH